MANLSRLEIIKTKPIGEGLNGFRDSFNSTCKDLGVSDSLDALHQIGNEELKDTLLDLILALQSLPASRSLSSNGGNKSLFGDLSRLNSAVDSDGFDIEQFIPLLNAILRIEPDEVIWEKVYATVTESTPPPRPLPFHVQTPHRRNTSSFANSSEHRKYVDDVLKEELGPLYVGIPGLYEAFFRGVEGLEEASAAVFKKCKEGDNPLYAEGGWRDWPEGAKERGVLKWFDKLIISFLDFAKEHGFVPKARRRLVEHTQQPLQGSTADRKLDIGFVDDLIAGESSQCHWSHILVPGELKSNPNTDIASKAWFDLGKYVREVFAAQDSRRFVLGFTLCGSIMRLWEYDRVGGIASLPFDINKDGLQFTSAMLGFLWMNEEQLGFDPTILTSDGKRYIEIVRNDQTERLILDELIKRARCIAGRATTCWKAHREGTPKIPLVIKDSWQYPEREEEGKLLHEISEKGVVNVARYYHHKTVRVSGQDDDIFNIRKGLDITKATNYKPEGLMMPPRLAGVQGSTRKGRSSSRKRSSSCSAPLPPGKRPCSTSPTKRPIIQNRVHRRVITSDYGKPLYKASSRAAILAALEGGIEGYESSYTQAGIIQCDISIGNLMMNEEDNNPSWPAFLIDFDLAIKEKREGPSGARGKTGTRAFMAIGVLLGEKHSFRHDLESFFWVLFWICVHYDGSGKDIGPTEFECWNYENTTKLAELKSGLVGREGHFLNRIAEAFTPYYQPLKPWVNRLRKVVFPTDGKWEKEDRALYSQMKEILQQAQKDPEVSAE